MNWYYITYSGQSELMFWSSQTVAVGILELIVREGYGAQMFVWNGKAWVSAQRFL